jgi:adenylate cyclase
VEKDRAADPRLQAAFAEEEYQGLQLAVRGRLLALAVIALWIPVENQFPEILFYYALLVGFAGVGVAPLLLHRARLDAPWTPYLLALLDVGLFTVAVLLPNPLERGTLPPPMRLRLGNEMYLFVFLTAPLLLYSPRLVLWTGLMAAAAWSVGTLWILSLPGSMGMVPRAQWANMTREEVLRVILSPNWVNVSYWGRLVVVLLVVSGILATAVWRSRRLVLRQVEAERERANLSRYFSPNMVDELAHSDEPLRGTRAQPVAVLFVDIVGFTATSARQSPDAVIAFLREFHRRMAGTVFAHGGTVDKYLGDGMMATFGTPRTSARDATQALRCARAMVHVIGAWNVDRGRHGEPPIGIGIGVHYGVAVLGNIGDERRLEFAVLGDTVNVASRLQELTRSTGTALIVSQDLIAAAQAEAALGPDDLSGLERIAPQPIRGREGTLDLWRLSSG